MQPGNDVQRYGFGVVSLGGLIGHNGEIPGYNSSMFHLPARRATIVVLTNLLGDRSHADEILAGLVGVLFPDLGPEGGR